MVTIHPLFHQHVSVKMEALVVVGTQTHAPVHLGSQEHFAPLASLHALLVLSSTPAPAAVVSGGEGVCCVCGCVSVCMCEVEVVRSYKDNMPSEGPNMVPLLSCLSAEAIDGIPT